MPYQNTPIGQSNPGLIMIVIDQSGSMSAAYEQGKSRADFAALAVNRTIDSILQGCKSMEKIKDRCFVMVIGYGAPTKNPKAQGQQAYLIAGGKISDLPSQMIRTEAMKQKISDGAGGLVEVDIQLPIWTESCCEDGTPMDEAFRTAEELAAQWVLDYPSNFPPIVIHITDGAPNDFDQAESAARSLMSVATSDGNLLLFNAHIDSAGREILLPVDNSEVTGQFQTFLYQISSEIPPSMLAQAKGAGLPARPGSKGVIINAKAEDLVRLIYFGSTQMRQ